MDKKKIEQAIENEIERLNGLYPDISPETKGRVCALIKNAAFLTVMLDSLQDSIIKKGGVADTYQNGQNQSGTKTSPEVNAYNSMVKNLGTVLKQINDMAGMKPAGKTGTKEVPDPFQAIRARGKT